MVDTPSDYRKAYESAKRELADLISKQEEIDKRKVELRKSIEALASLCKTEEIGLEPSAEAAYLLTNSTLAEEVQAILKSQWPLYLRPHQVKAQLEKLGHDLTKYQNPQAAIHMILKRMVETDDAEEHIGDDEKQMYRFPPMWLSIAEKGDDAVKQVAKNIMTARKKK